MYESLWLYIKIIIKNTSKFITKYIVVDKKIYKFILLSAPAHVCEGCEGSSSRLSLHHLQHIAWLKLQAVLINPACSWSSYRPFLRALSEKVSEGGWGATEKLRPKNSTIKPLSTLSVSCIKIQSGRSPLAPLPPPPRFRRPWPFPFYFC